MGVNLNHLKPEFKVINEENKTIVMYSHNYNEHCADNRITITLYDENIIDKLESNIAANVTYYKKVSKKRKELYKELIKEMNRFSLELIGNIQTYTHVNNGVTKGYNVVSGLIQAYKVMFYRSSLFCEVTDYIYLLEDIQEQKAI